MQQFAGNLFMMARRADHHGMSKEAKDLFDLALTLCLKPRWDHRVFGIATSVLGWKTASRIARFAKNSFAPVPKPRNVPQIARKTRIPDWVAHFYDDANLPR